MLQYYEVTINFLSFDISSLDYEISKRVCFKNYIAKDLTLRFVN